MLLPETCIQPLGMNGVRKVAENTSVSPHACNVSVSKLVDPFKEMADLCDPEFRFT